MAQSASSILWTARCLVEEVVEEVETEMVTAAVEGQPAKLVNALTGKWNVLRSIRDDLESRMEAAAQKEWDVDITILPDPFDTPFFKQFLP